MKNSNEPIGNRTRDLPACSSVPQSTAPPRAIRIKIGNKENLLYIKTNINPSNTIDYS
jgi:hypothetical protein